MFPDLQINCMCCENHLKDNKHNSLHLVRENALIFVIGHYLFLTVILELRSLKTVRFPEQIMSMDKYWNIFSCQTEAIVYIRYMTSMVSKSR